MLYICHSPLYPDRPISFIFSRDQFQLDDRIKFTPEELGLNFSLQVFKLMITATNYTYNLNGNGVWSTLYEQFVAWKDIISLHTSKVQFVELKFFTDFVEGKNLSPNQAKEFETAEEFFYTDTQPTTSSQTKLSLTEITLKISELAGEAWEESKAKKLYLRAALKCHPDCNNGQAEKMTELNVLWQEYQKIQQKEGIKV
jgi:hypothetical protein